MSAYLPGSYEELAVQAQQYLRNNDYDQAREIYERIYNRLSKMKAEVIERRPKLKQLKLTSLRMLGDLAGFQGEFDQAIAYYEAGLEVDPEESLIYRRAIAQARIDRGDVEAGLDELRALAVMNAGDPRPWIWLGLELWAHGDLNEAIENMARAATLTEAEAEPRAEAYTYLHDLYREANRLEEAEAAWQKAWRVMGQSMDDVSPLYQMYYEVGQLDKARQWLNKEKNPLRAGFYRGLFAQAEGDEKRARAAWQKTARLNPLERQEGHEAWAEAALQVNHPPQAIANALRDVNGREQLNIRGMILLAIALARTGQVRAAESALQSAIDVNQRARPRKDLLSADQWALFEELVADAETKTQLRHYFEA